MFYIQERQLGHYARAALVDGGSRYHNAPPCRLASKVRQNAGRSLATRLFLSQVAYLVHDDFEILMLDSVLVGPSVRVELSGKEDFLTFLEEIPWDALLVVLELLLEDYAAEEARGLVVLGEVLRESEACESLSFVRCHVGCKSA